MTDLADLKALAFDYYGTIADKQALGAIIDGHFPGRGAAMAKLWFATTQRYCFQNGMMGRHMPWDRLTMSAFAFAAAETGIKASDALRDQLIAADAALPPYAEVAAVLPRLAARFSLYVLSMGSPWMIGKSQRSAGIDGHFTAVISAEPHKLYKPGKAAYELGVREIGLPSHQIGFVSGNSFDVIGARNYGLPAIWVRRYGQPLDGLGLEPTLTVRDLGEMADALGA